MNHDGAINAVKALRRSIITSMAKAEQQMSTMQYLLSQWESVLADANAILELEAQGALTFKRLAEFAGRVTEVYDDILKDRQ